MRFLPEQNQYISSCARIRGICVTALMARIVEVICRDQLVLSILDDEGDHKRRPSEHAFRKQKGE